MPKNDKRKKYRVKDERAPAKKKETRPMSQPRALTRQPHLCAAASSRTMRERKREGERERKTKSEGGHSERGKKSTQKDRPSERDLRVCTRICTRVRENDGDQSGDQRDGTGPTVQSRKQGTALT